ncbi:hypothetical protein QTO30_10255 [Yoonia sp. GPGPB17]
MDKVLFNSVYLETVAVKSLCPGFVNKHLRITGNVSNKRDIAANAIINMAAFLKYIRLHESEERKNYQTAIKDKHLTPIKYDKIFLFSDIVSSLKEPIDAMIDDIASQQIGSQKRLDFIRSSLANIQG